MKRIVIIGAGGFGREIQWLIERINSTISIDTDKWEIKGYIDDGLEIGTVVDGYEVIGGVSTLSSCMEKMYAVCAIVASSTRKKVIDNIIKNPNIEFPNLIDPSVLISDRVSMGKGNIICAGSIITVDIEFGDFNIINLDCTIGHDVILNSFVTVYPSVNISGNVEIGNCSELGTGTQIIQGKNIDNNAIIGAGAVVVRDIPANCTAVGAPCKVIKYH